MKVKQLTYGSSVISQAGTAPRGAIARRLHLLLLSLLVALIVAGCASLPGDFSKSHSQAVEDYAGTYLGSQFRDTGVQHPNQSGFAIIRYGRPAFTDRVALTELAEKTLDVQYYIWEEDETGRILAERLVRAADRGVRVRFLVDDINLGDRDDIIASLDAHPNIEVRVFNPFAKRGGPGLSFIADFDRVNHRMHNKMMIFDNALAIVGGRNVGNHYFAVATDANFRDLDIGAAGPIVREVSAVFDYFWNGDWSYPITALVDRPYTEADLHAAVATIRSRIDQGTFPYPLDQTVDELKMKLESILADLVWAPAVVVWDDPAAALEEDGKTSRMNEALYRRVDQLQSELLIESAYFVPRERAVAKMGELHDRGVKVRVLTNSLASNDVLAAHAGYSRRRKQLVENGVELYELRPDPGPVSKQILAGDSKAALHTKAIVFDRKDIFIGSFNLDPRSGDINTEAGIYVESPQLAAELIDFMDNGVDPQNSYRVLLDEEGKLYWETETDAETLRYDKDPRSTGWQRFQVGFIRLFPVDDQL
jgi:putative cardiolipin synthase